MLRNSTQLQAFFEERRRIKANQKQQLKLKKAKEYKIKAREKYYLQKQLKQEAKYLKIRELQELVEKISKIAQLHKNKTKEITTVETYHLPTRERYSSECNLYTTWDEIKEAEKRGEGKINWPNLFQLILKVKNKLKTL